nr:hypothetical protein GCM10020185_50710 [Pseudomonas brassicacearum subsp. brassicacearum]
MLVKEGTRVSNGQALLRYDLDSVAQRCKSLVSLLIITNGEHFQARPITLKGVKVGEPLLHIVSKTPGETRDDEADVGIEVFGQIRIAHRGGLHARPAALVRQTAQGFKSRSHLHFSGRSASCDSVMGMMGLAITEQAEVHVSCRGSDAEAALQALLKTLSTALAEEAHAEAPPAKAPSRSAEDGVLHGVCAAPGLVSGALVHLEGIQLPEDVGGSRRRRTTATASRCLGAGQSRDPIDPGKRQGPAPRR